MKEHKHETKNTKAVAGAIILFEGRPHFAKARERVKQIDWIASPTIEQCGLRISMEEGLAR